MKYSFILIAFNEEHSIADCIKSVTRQDQLTDSYEIIVFNDGSTDRTEEIVNELAKKNSKIKLIGDGQNHGRGYGRLKGVEASNGQYVAMIDADILLPKTWLSDCLKSIKNYDIVGGIAVPDGDVAYIHRRFKLSANPVMGSTTITGNNGLYRSELFQKVNFNPTLREGEDVDFNHRANAAGFSAYCIPGLTVEHHESKSFLRSLQWLFISGIGATRQLFNFKEIRLPDIAFFGFTVIILLTLISIVALSITKAILILPLCYAILSSTLHLHGKFQLSKNPVQSLFACIVNSIFILSYYAGRIIGIFNRRIL